MTEILIGRNDSTSVSLDPHYGNRHGMIAGATGTGKSVSLMVLAEGFSRLGVPCFLADAKGDLAGLSMAAGEPGDKLKARLGKLKLTDWKPQANPVVFWDIYGKLGHPVRATISEMGPTLLGRVLELNDTQEGVLEVVFKAADDQGWLLLDLADLRALLGYAAENAKALSTQYGLISTTSIAAIQRALLKLEGDGADQFFGEPALELADLMRQDLGGRGIINVLAADQLILKPRLYSTFLLWLLSELFEQLPEVGDLEQPKMVFFFDEAHLLFDDASPALLQRVEQVVRLIRSKGVGVYFCSQNPDDVPGVILGQLGNRIQHALRAFTPRDQKAVKAAAETFVANPKLDVSQAITQLAVGEALASTLGHGGVPSPVEQVLVTAPCCRIGAITDAERATIRQRSPVGGKYDNPLNRESAAEMLARRASDKATADATAAADAPAKGTAKEDAGTGWSGAVHDALFGTKRRQGMIETMGKQMVRTAGSQLGRQILRGVLGGIFGGKR
ncbi:MAG: helicase HerA-like domain-containing protein [Rhodanobacter sp.]|uniref:helicase HerA-like domain-containing protein n=1 Tax=Rhodanobacter sp. KK11 TaxID=3083255 RepID=UPI002965D237|nr:helicase HerA-like domain-containing protein [Rhodanobacter sp. KK11]MDW2981010.1 helicase HerA-like domain-containing protein [Rhodanobacter sp. KK11]